MSKSDEFQNLIRSINDKEVDGWWIDWQGTNFYQP
jgi:hypothetical protein